MIQYLIGVVLFTTVSLAQTTQQPDKNTDSAKPKSATTAGATATAPQAATASGPPRPLPEHPLETKLQNESNVNPNYRKEKRSGRGTKREYTPRRTASGVRKDTLMNRRKP